MYLHPYPLDLHPPLHAPLSRQTHARPTQVPFGLALCPRPTHPSDPVVTGPLPGPLHPLTPHLLTHCPTLPLAFFLSLQPTITTHTGLQRLKCTGKAWKSLICTCAVYILVCFFVFWGVCVCWWGRGFQQCLMRLGRMSGNGRKSASPLCLSLQLLSPLCQLFFNSASQPLYLNMFLSHLSITSFQSIFICVASRSLSQSISVALRALMCLPVSLSLSVPVFFFVVFLCAPSLCLVRNS